MKVFVVLLSILAAAAAIDIDWTKIEPRHVNPEILEKIPSTPSLNRITGGIEAEPHQFPYQCALILEFEEGKTAFCGCSVIDSEWVLTAAHCVDGVKRVNVKLGAHNVKVPEPHRIEQNISKENILVHEEYNAKTISNDIALIRISSVKFNKYIQPVNLPCVTDAKNDFKGLSVVASGWGKSTDSATGISDTLRYIDSKVYSPLLCKIWTIFIASTDSNICIDGKNTKSTCNGDSGGPLVLTKSDKSKTIVGITSFGLSFGCEKGWPAVFTRVTYYLNWIKRITKMQLCP